MGLPDTPTSCSTHCGLFTSSLTSLASVPHSLELLPPALLHISDNNIHFPVTAQCAKGQENGKEGNMEDRHLSQEGFLEEAMPKLSLKG